MIPSLPKLLGLIAIIWMVWTVFRIYETRQAAGRTQNTKDDDKARHDASYSAAERDSTDANHSVELRECKTCEAWVNGENCGRKNCPY